MIYDDITTTGVYYCDHRVAGAAMNESILPPTGGFGGKPTMTSIAPKWAEQVRQGLLRPALFGDCVTQDNVGAPLYGPSNGCCDMRSNALFMEMHGDTLGLPTNFSLGPYIQSLRHRGLSGVDLVQDRVVREIIRFHFVENLKAWKTTYTAIKVESIDMQHKSILNLNFTKISPCPS